MKTIYMRVESVGPDPIQYKPYNPRLISPKRAPIFVQYTIDDEDVVYYPQAVTVKRLPKGSIIITPKGLAKLMVQQSLAIRQIVEGG